MELEHHLEMADINFADFEGEGAPTNQDEWEALTKDDREYWTEVWIQMQADICMDDEDEDEDEDEEEESDDDDMEAFYAAEEIKDWNSDYMRSIR